MNTEAHNPALQQARFDRASALLGQKDFRAAAAILQDLVQVSPLLLPARFNLGLCHYALGEYAQARPHLDLCYLRDERSAGLLRLIVSTYHHLQLIDEAVAIADANEGPAQADAATAGVYALLYLDAGLAAQAQRWAAQALKANPQNLDGLIVEATLRSAAQDVPGARSLFGEVLKRAPDSARAWLGLGALALLEQDFAAAKAHLTRALEGMPTHVGTWHVRAWAHIFSRDLDAAEADFEHALELDRNFAETHGGLAAIAALRSDRTGAQRAIERARRLDAQCLSATFAESVLMGHAGHADAARALIAKTVAGLSSGARRQPARTDDGFCANL